MSVPRTRVLGKVQDLNLLTIGETPIALPFRVNFRVDEVVKTLSGIRLHGSVAHQLGIQNPDYSLGLKLASDQS